MATEFGYLLNAMERAACEHKPAEHDYHGKRLAVLAYVTTLEAERDRLRAELAELRKPDCFRCAYWFACRTLIKDDCGGGDKFVPKRDPVRLYEKE